MLNQISNICTEEDHWLKEKLVFYPRWLIELTDDTIVYQDDERTGIEPSSAWLRLKAYCQETNLGIRKMSLQWRTINIQVGENADGFFFCKEILASTELPENIHYYLTGTINQEILTIDKWEMPGLIKVSTKVQDYDVNSDCIIWTPK